MLPDRKFRLLSIELFQITAMLSLLLVLVNTAASQVLYEELNALSLHPRTFHLSKNQEFQVISQVLCAGLPCPEYNIIQDYAYFIQLRSYRESTYLKLTAPITCRFKLTIDDAKKRLKSYIKGNNNREQKYSATLPLLIEVNYAGSKSTNPWCAMSYEANFYTPHYWGIIATPTEILPDFKHLSENLQVYVHTFVGDIEEVLLREIELFRRNLDVLGLCYKKLTFYIAIYEFLHSPADSRNELWFIKCPR